jgi:Uma2 family endonuclease
MRIRYRSALFTRNDAGIVENVSGSDNLRKEGKIMASVAESTTRGNRAYPTSDGKPMAETDHHRELMLDLIESLKAYYAAQPMVYVSGNLLLFYESGNKRRHVSPDVFVVKGVPKGARFNYLTWEEGHNPDFVVEVTSSSTRNEDVTKKFRLYRDTLKVKEYFLFDPFGDYLKPPLQGYRLRAGEYHPIRAVEGRLPSRVLGLHLERDDSVRIPKQRGSDLRLYDPATARWLPNRAEEVTLAKAEAEQAADKAKRAEEHVTRVEEHAARVEAENQRLLREMEELRRRLGQQP